MLLLLALACTPPDVEISDTGRVTCGPGYARADDGNCYAMDDGGPAAYDVQCDGDASYWSSTPVDALTVDVWGYVTEEAAAWCDDWSPAFDVCESLGRAGERGAGWAPWPYTRALENEGLSVYCMRYPEAGDGDGPLSDWPGGFAPGQIRIYVYD